MVEALRHEFDLLPKRERFRGKFAMMFFLKWLEHLAAERTNSESTIFAEVPKNVKVRFQEVAMDNLAVKAAPPASLADFVRQMKTPVAA